jgi:hypothetical protein
MSNRRAALTRFIPFSYFWICWNEMPRILAISAWLMWSASRRSRIRLPMYLSTVLVLLGDVDFRLAFLMSSLAFDDLEEAIAADADAPIGIRVEV